VNFATPFFEPLWPVMTNNGRFPSMSQPPPDDEPEPEPEPESDADRRRANLIILAVVALLIVGGLWVVNALIDASKAEECMESGRRNCETIPR
jgi:hypothetical protein